MMEGDGETDWDNREKTSEMERWQTHTEGVLWILVSHTYRHKVCDCYCDDKTLFFHINVCISKLI